MALGDVCWADLPDAAGHAQQGRRPVVVIHDDSYMGSLPTVVAIPLAATLRAARFPGTVPVAATAGNGLPRDSVALVFQLRTIDRTQLERPIGNVGPAVLGQLYAMLDRVTGRTRPHTPSGGPTP